MANTQDYTAVISEPLHIGAASSKMISVVRAMRDAGVKAYFVTLPVLGRKSRVKYVPTVMLRSSEGPQIYLQTVANPYFRKVLALLCFACFCFFKVKKIDRVIIYNTAVEYFLGLLILAIKGNRPILDIEDAPREDETGWYGRVGRFSYYIFNKLVCNRKLIVSEVLATALDLKQYCVVYGAKRIEFIVDRNLNQYSWGTGAISEPFTVHYGGSLMSDSGVDLFCDAVEILLGMLRCDILQLHFIVTGFGSEDKINKLQRSCEGSGVRISYYPNLPPEKYISQFRRCHAALSLKLPESKMAMTTFPSKVVDITTNGLLLISTKASDVPFLFNDSNAIFLPDVAPATLANTIKSVIENPLSMSQVAKLGQTRAIELFESKVVGKRIADFILKYDD